MQVKACCGSVQMGLGGSMGMALGPVGRSADASVMVSMAAHTHTHTYTGAEKAAARGASLVQTYCKVICGALCVLCPQLGSAALTTPGAAYAYSCSQGAFFGVSLEGSLLTVRGLTHDMDPRV